MISELLSRLGRDPAYSVISLSDMKYYYYDEKYMIRDRIIHRVTSLSAYLQRAEKDM